MNQLVSLNNQAVECLLKGDAFEACNIFMNMTSLYMQISNQVQTPTGSRRYHQHSNVKIQWVPIPTTIKEEGNDDSFCTKMNVNNTDHHHHHNHHNHHHHQYYQHHHHHHHHHHQEDDSSSSSSSSVILPYNHALFIRKACCCGSGGVPFLLRRRAGTTAAEEAFCSDEILVVPEDKICMHCWDDYDICPCTIAPVMWYNLAITCQTLALLLQQQQSRSSLLPSSSLSSSSAIMLDDETIFYFKRSLYLYEQALDIIGHGPTVTMTTTNNSNGNNNNNNNNNGDDNHHHHHHHNDDHNNNMDNNNNHNKQGFLEYFMNAALPNHCFIKTLRLAIWNNMSSIYFTLGQFEASKRGIQTLQLQLQRQQPLYYQHWGSGGTTSGGGGRFWFPQEQQHLQLQEGITRMFYENIASFFHLSQGPSVAGAA